MDKRDGERHQKMGRQFSVWDGGNARGTNRRREFMPSIFMLGVVGRQRPTIYPLEAPSTPTGGRIMDKRELGLLLG